MKLFIFEAVQRTDNTDKPYGKGKQSRTIQKAVKPLFYEPETTQPSPYLWGDSTGDLLKDSSSSYIPESATVYKRVLYSLSTAAMVAQFPQL